jgi:DNA-directed RNA polymerase subunit M/transcription elongation factor TFIIS
MICKECGEEMYLESTRGFYCKRCKIHTDLQGNLLSREESKVKISSKRTINTIGTIATIRRIEATA